MAMLRTAVVENLLGSNFPVCFCMLCYFLFAPLLRRLEY